MDGFSFSFAFFPSCGLVLLSLWERARPPAPPAPREPAVVLAPASFASLEGWREDDHAPALAAFLRSCERLARLSVVD